MCWYMVHRYYVDHQQLKTPRFGVLVSASVFDPGKITAMNFWSNDRQDISSDFNDSSNQARIYKMNQKSSAIKSEM